MVHRIPGLLFEERPVVDLTDRIIRESEHPIVYGAFGDVYQCRCRGEDGPESPLLVAVETLRYQPEAHLERDKRGLRREVGLLKRLHHPNIVPLLGVTSGFGPLPAIVSPWMIHGTLHRYLENRRYTLTMSERLQLVHGIGCGIEYLHSNRVFHGDLHSGNVLMDANHNPRICDFGLASTIGKVQPGLSYLERLSSSNNPGAVRWAAPERLQGCKPHSSADIYSFGCIMFELLCGELPWKEKSNYEVIALKLREHEPPRRPNHGAIGEEYWALMWQCICFTQAVHVAVQIK